MNTIRELQDTVSQVSSPTDPIGLDAARTIARQIIEIVRDPKMHHSIPLRVGRAIADRQLNPSELKEILDIVLTQRLAGRLRSPGAYFVTSIKRVFQRNEIPW